MGIQKSGVILLFKLVNAFFFSKSKWVFVFVYSEISSVAFLSLKYKMAYCLVQCNMGIGHGFIGFRGKEGGL